MKYIHKPAGLVVELFVKLLMIALFLSFGFSLAKHFVTETGGIMLVLRGSELWLQHWCVLLLRVRYLP